MQASQTHSNNETEELQTQITSFRTQLRTANQLVLCLAANIAVGMGNAETEDQSNSSEGTSMDPKKLVALQKEKYLMEHRPK
jgi:hypothetical protein